MIGAWGHMAEDEKAEGTSSLGTSWASFGGCPRHPLPCVLPETRVFKTTTSLKCYYSPVRIFTMSASPLLNPSMHSNAPNKNFGLTAIWGNAETTSSL